METNNIYLSYLMGGVDITDKDLSDLDIDFNKLADGDRALKIPKEKMSQYKELVRQKLGNGFWNEMIGESEIIFVFKFKDGSVEEYKLSPENEQKIDQHCAELNNEQPDKTANVYKYISENTFYHDFMVKHYSSMINR